MQNLEKFLNTRDDLTLFMRFAFTGINDRFNRLMSDLSNLAEEEPWTQEEELDILKTYINKTFEKCFQQGDIMINNDESECFFDTGLLTKNLEKIYCYMKKNDRDTPYWKLLKFCAESDVDIVKFPEKPKKADYFSTPKDYYFNPKANITVNSSHIYDDEHVKDRFPEDIKKLPNEDLVALIRGKIKILQDRIERNPRLVVPLYYKEKITFACPIKILNYTFALIVEKYDDESYRVNTIFPLEVAYKKARILMKPESNWLEYKEKDTL